MQESSLLAAGVRCSELEAQTSSVGPFATREKRLRFGNLRERALTATNPLRWARWWTRNQGSSWMATLVGELVMLDGEGQTADGVLPKVRYK